MNIDFYVQRDGETSARETVRMHFRNYLEGLTNQRSHISTRDYRPKFVDSLLRMAQFLGDIEAARLIGEVLETVEKRAGKSGLDNAFLRPFLHFTSRVQFIGVTTALNALKTYPLDEKDPLAQVSSGKDSVHTLRVSADDYVRAVAVLEAANIAVN